METAPSRMWKTILTRGGTAGILRFLLAFALAFLAFALVLLLAGKNPLQAYVDIFAGAFSNTYGFSEVLVRMIPLMLTAVAVALPARIGLINVGAEGQLYIGALFATWGALNLSGLPQAVLLPAMFVLSFLGGGLWAAISGFLRARGWVSETISTLLSNYVAILLINFFVFGPWRDPLSANYPQSPEFTAAARLPMLAGTRIHLGLVFAVAALILFHLLLKKTRWGLEMRAIGGNQDAARRNGINIGRYILGVMLAGGGIAGLAGLGEVAAIQGRLRPSLSPGYGFIGFLVAWLSGGSPPGIAAAAFLMAVISAGGDTLQIVHGLPGAAVDILMALMLFVVLAQRGRKAGVR
ncbi:MAG: ABC transporter permease [Patescibacteria group bacterium]